jgi:hypothetical protein
MGRITTRIARGLAALAVATTAGSLLAATPAHADSRWDVNYDHVVLGASSTNSFKAFDGYLEAYYSINGTIRAELTGPFIGHGTLKAVFTMADGSTQSDSNYTAGVQHNIDFYPSAGHTVVKTTVTYTPNSGSVETKTFNTGEAPDSTGSCTRLDQDNLSISQSGFASFNGNVWYGCTADGHVYAQPSGTATWSGGAGVSNEVEFIIWYTDGTSEIKTTPVLSSTRTSATIGAMSDTTKSVTWVNSRLERFVNGRTDPTMPMKASKFGENG